MGETRDIAVGQIWREVDPRFDRHIRIESASGLYSRVGVRTVVLEAGAWTPAAKSRLAYAAPERFNGKRGNYEFVATPTPATASL